MFEINQIKTIFLITIGTFLIFIGITFLSNQFLPSYLGQFYKNTPKWLQLLIFAFLISIPANLMFAKAYQTSSASFTGVVYIVSVILGSLILAILIDNVKINLNIIIATLAMLGSAVWLTLILESSKKL